MLKILDARQIIEVDRLSVIRQNISSFDLMERASLSVYMELVKGIYPFHEVFVFAGSGNNGGDALAVARMLLTSDIKPQVFIVSTDNNLSPDCRTNKERLERLIPIFSIRHKDDIPFIPSGCIIIDGLFGSGINRPLGGIYADVVQAINNSQNKVYSIDMPSGLFIADNSENNLENVVKAEKVFTFQVPKLSLLLPESDAFCQKLDIFDIGLSTEAIEEMPSDYFLTEKEDVAAILKPRSRFSHKGDFGRAFLIAGSHGKTGAAVLAAQACLRTGVGLLTVHAPQCSLDVLQVTTPEAMVDVDVSPDFVTNINFDLDNCTVGVGCGIGTATQTREMMAKLLVQNRKPMVIDADALNIISSDEQMKHDIPHDSIITPHPAEFERLIGRPCANGYERLEAARRFAAQHHIYIVLKGAYSAVVTPDRKVYFNPTGNPGMATGGSGDALTGIITSLLAQKYTPFDAALLGVYIHGLAGDLAAKAKHERSMLPTDLIGYLGRAYRILDGKN